MRTRILVCLLSVIVFLGAGSVNSADAAEIVYESGERFVEYNEDLEDDLYISGDENVSVEGNIDGDLFIAGGRIDVDGNVTGTLYSAGGMITINGSSEGNVVIAGGQIDIKGDVGRTVYAAGGTLNVNGNVGEDVMIAGGQINIIGNVGDDVRVAGGTVRIDGNIGDDLMAGVGQLDLRGSVGGDAYISGDSVLIRSESIKGDLVFYGNENSIDLKESTEVGGDFKVEEPKFQTEADLKLPGLAILQLSGFALFMKLFFSFMETLGLILLGWLVYKFAPVKIENTIGKMHGWNEAGKSLGIGFVAIPVGIFAAIFLGISIVGWPTMGVLMSLVAIAVALVVPIAGLYFGRWILEQFNIEGHTILSLLIGVFLIQIIRLIPVIGWLLYAVLFLIAIGAMLRMQYEKYQLAKEVKKK